MGIRQYATFEVHDQLFGVDVSDVQEILRVPEYSAVPLTQDAIVGLFNLRGQVVTAIDLRVQLGLPPRTTNQGVMNVVVRVHEEVISLLVDNIGQVISIDDDELEATPDTVARPYRTLVVAAFALADRLLLVLDILRATDTADQAVQSEDHDV